MPDDAKFGDTIHIIVEGTDDGAISMTRSMRCIFNRYRILRRFYVDALMIAHMLGNISLGSFFGCSGMLKGSMFLGLSCLVFPILALNADVPALIWIFALFYGPTSAGFSVPAAMFVSTYFGRRTFAAIFSVINLTAQIGTAFSGPSTAVIYDMTGSYI